MTPTEKLALALAAIEAAKGMASQSFYQHNDIGDWYCECCHRVVNSRTTHKGNCDLQEFLDAVTKLEQSE